jgi:hypothetical protein
MQRGWPGRRGLFGKMEPVCQRSRQTPRVKGETCPALRRPAPLPPGTTRRSAHISGREMYGTRAMLPWGSPPDEAIQRHEAGTSLLCWGRLVPLHQICAAAAYQTLTKRTRGANVRGDRGLKDPVAYIIRMAGLNSENSPKLLQNEKITAEGAPDVLPT